MEVVNSTCQVCESATFPGFGWVEPYMDREGPLLELTECQAIAQIPPDDATRAAAAAVERVFGEALAEERERMRHGVC